MDKIDEKNRWEINKLGILNYWWYDEEELEFADGRLILRGTNGSGKSVTMQSFIPLLLDGNKSPERLDPFNTKARKIEDYVLGYGESIKEENTSYLYMEFCKKETKNHITVGIGLRGKKNQGVSFWGFLIKDGRRIGKDFYLYKDLGNKIPLTKQELKNRIGEGGQVVDTAKEYASLVNSNIFGFETMEEYQEFIKLLIEIRTPKLSKDGFKPSIITEIMSNALRPLSDEDLRTVSESIENMNKTKEQLEILQTSEKAVENISIPYEKYNKCVLYHKAKKYATINKAYHQIKKEELENEDKLKSGMLNLEQTSQKLEDTTKKIEVYQYKQKELQGNELWKQKEEQAKMEERILELENDINGKKKSEEEKKTNIIKKEAEEKQSKEQYEIEEENFKEKQEEMKDIAEEIQYDEYFFRIDEIKENINQIYHYENFKNDIKRYITKIEEGKKALEKEGQASKDYEYSLESVDKEKNERARQESKVNKTREELEEKKENFIENVYAWEKENALLKMEQEELNKISLKVQSYGNGAEYDDIKCILNDIYTNKSEKYNQVKATLHVQKQELEKKIDNVKIQIEEWKNKKEPEPEKSQKIIQNRQKLKELGIPFVELYNAVDFKNDIEEKTKGIIETALLDMGILDALIIPKEYTERIKQVDLGFIDKYLYANPMEFKYDLSNILDVKLQENAKIKPETVYNILKSIMIEDEEAPTFVSEKGYYKIGVINGRIDTKEKPKYIGRKAREEYKQIQIQVLEEEMIELKKDKEQIEIEFQKLEETLDIMSSEYNRFPTKTDMEGAYIQLRKEITNLEFLKTNVENLEKILTQKFERLKELKQQTMLVTQKLRFLATTEIYEEKLEQAIVFKEKIFEMEKIHTSIVNLHEKMQSTCETLDNLKWDLDSILYEKLKMERESQTLKEKVESIKELMSSDISDLEKQMEDCIKQLNELPKVKEDLIGAKATIASENLKIKEDAIQINERVNVLYTKSNMAKDILEQELNLKYVVEEYDEINKITNKIVNEYSYFDKDTNDLNSYYRILVDKYREYKDDLTDYNLTVGNIFVEELNETITELEELLKTRTRSDITCFIKGKKVNLNSLKKDIKETIDETKNLVDDEDRHLFEEILIGAVGRKIRERIYSAKEWVSSMNELMKSLNTSSGLSFSLNWRPKLATDEGELDIKEIVDILNSDAGLLRQEEITKVATHFRKKFAKAEAFAKEKGNFIPFYMIMKEALDYRNWFEFQFMHKKPAEQARELTNNAFFKLSGGEKAMAMYIPLFASVYARYESARNDCPRIISLDEAFAGVDDNNIRDMFRILTELELEYVINSQMLWGEYDTVPSLSICELISDVNTKVVSVVRYRWDGMKRTLVGLEEYN